MCIHVRKAKGNKVEENLLKTQELLNCLEICVVHVPAHFSVVLYEKDLYMYILFFSSYYLFFVQEKQKRKEKPTNNST